MHGLRDVTPGMPAVIGLLVTAIAFAPAAPAIGQGQTKFKRIPTQYIAALGDPAATSGTDAQSWGLWRVDPGPRGVWLGDFERLMAEGGVAPARWAFDRSAWWLEENGLIMEKPAFPVPPGKYVVTGNRNVVSVLTIHPTGDDGARRWELEGG